MKFQYAIFFIIIFISSCKSSNDFIKGEEKLSNEDYSVINSLVGIREKEGLLYFKVSSSNNWINYLNLKEFKNLYGPPCKDENSIIPYDKIFSRIDLDKISMNSNHEVLLSQEKLSKKIKLTQENHENIIKISKPIIINDYAILKIDSKNSEVILIALKRNDKWKVICTKWISIIIDN